jgi:cellulose synthase operon protein C
LSEIASRHPGNRQVLTALGELKLRRQDWIGAQEVADTIRRVGDQSGIADQIRGQALSGQNKQNESIQALRTALQATPNALSPMVKLVSAYMRAQRPDQAESFLKDLLRANPGNANALVLMGSVQLAKGQPEQTLRSIQSAIEQQPRNPIGYIALAEFHLRQRNLTQALAAAQAGLREQPDNFGLRLRLAAIWESMKDFEGAMREYEGILAQQPNSLVAANNLASLLSEYREDKASLERAQALGAMLRKSNIPHFKDTLGWLSYHRGDNRTAIMLLEEAVVELPTRSVVRYHLGMAYLKAGQSEKGQEQLKKAAELATGEAQLKQKIENALKGS